MIARSVAAVAVIVATGVGSEALGQAPSLPAFTQVLNGYTEIVTYRGVRAVKLVPAPETAGKDEDMMAILDRAEFKDGTIQIDVAGSPRPGVSPDSRGFIGISFRTGPRGEWSEMFYLRTTNGRAEDQLRRNHTVQYVSHPDFPWHRLREESPGDYESYADMEAGAWTPSSSSERATTRCAATVSAMRKDSTPSGSAPTTRQSR